MIIRQEVFSLKGVVLAIIHIVLNIDALDWLFFPDTARLCLCVCFSMLEAALRERQAFRISGVYVKLSPELENPVPDGILVKGI